MSDVQSNSVIIGTVDGYTGKGIATINDRLCMSCMYINVNKV